ncbi:hypothetical protein [Nannocystis pusilla]|uniref:hypothetical protein n=1 Tax=Nannocystis pusilla TaxID=889268 RepID=UPI003BF0120D
MRCLGSLGLCCLLACPAPAVDDVDDEAPDAASQVTAPPGTATAMVDHFHDSLRIKNAVIAGDLAEVPPAARRLAEQLVPERFPAAWRDHLGPTTRMAATAGAARELPEAAAAAAGLASACGDCHAAIGKGPEFPAPGVPPVGESHDTRAHMARHQWAADRMWEALVSRSEPAWSAGATALVNAPLNSEDLTRDVELPQEALDLGVRVHDLAARATRVTDWPARTAIYGEFLASCAGCHTGGC